MPFLHSRLARVSDLEFGSVASFMSLASGLLVDFLDIVQQGHQSYQSPAPARRPISEEEERRECHLEQLYRLLPPRDRGAKNYRNLLASVGLGGQLDVSSRGRQTGQQLRGQSVSDGIGKLGPNITFQARVGHRVASNSEGGRVDRWSRSHRRQSQSTWRTS